VVVEDEEEEFLLEVGVSRREKKSNQAEGTGRPVPEEAKKRNSGTVVETGEPVPEIEKSGELPDPMDVDPTVQTGGSSVGVEEREVIGADPDLESGVGDLRMEDFPEDVFEKVGDLSPEPSQGPPVQGQELAAQTPLGSEPRKKRVKTLAGRTDLP